MRTERIISWLAGFLLLSFVGTLEAQFSPAEWRDIDGAAIPLNFLSFSDAARLRDPHFAWQHAETAHFYIHYEKKMFAQKVARLGEQFYDHISTDFPPLPDRVSPHKSHIFIIRDAKDWTAIAATFNVSSNVISFVHGNVMYLQPFGDSKAEQMSLLAHEMTHLVINRFLLGAAPLWLNEGMAEYYREFAYAAVRGIGKSKRSAFPPLKKWMPLQDVLSATEYPEKQADALLFYHTSKYLVGFLILTRSANGQWHDFLVRILNGENSTSALLSAFGFEHFYAITSAFFKFAT